MSKNFKVIAALTIVSLGLLAGAVMVGRSNDAAANLPDVVRQPLVSDDANLPRTIPAQPAGQMQGGLSSPLNLSALTSGADLIVVGRATDVEDRGLVQTEVLGTPVQARRVVTALQVARVLKNESKTPIPEVLRFEVLEKVSSGLASGTFGIFFLRQKSPGSYEAVDPDRPFVSAVTEAPQVKVNTVVDSVAAEVAQVALSPEVPIDRRKQAISTLSGVRSALVKLALQRLAKNDNAEVRARALTASLNNGDSPVLDTAVDVLLQPSPDLPAYELQNLAYAVMAGPKDAKSIPSLTRLLNASEAELRRAGAEGLRQVGGPDVVEPLSKALDDSDQQVRYNAVMGLAKVTKSIDQVPSIDAFERDEQRYVNHWREKMRRTAPR